MNKIEKNLILLALPYLEHISRLSKPFFDFLLKIVAKILITPEIKSIAIQGSFNRSSWRLFFSDIDLVIVIYDFTNEEQAKRLSKKIKWIKKVIIFIKDIDILEEKQFSLWKYYGGLEALEIESWLFLYGKEEKKEYFYHPLKFKLDQLNKITAYYEWFVLNQTKSELSLYRKIITLKLLFKIDLLLSNITSSKSLIPLEDEQHFWLWLKDKSWLNKSILDIWQEILIKNSININLATQIIPKDCYSYLGKNKHQFDSLINTYEEKKFLNLLIISGTKNLEAYYYLGINSSNVINRKIFLGMFYTELIRRNINYEISEYQNYLNSLKDKTEIVRELNLFKSNLKSLISHPIDTNREIVLVSSSWGKNTKFVEIAKKSHTQLKKQNLPFMHIHFALYPEEVDLNSFDDLLIYKIKFKEQHAHLWHKEQLQNLIKNFFYENKILVFIDADVYTQKTNWLDLVKFKLNNGIHILQGFSDVIDNLSSQPLTESWVKKFFNQDIDWKAPGLIWAMYNTTFSDLDGFNSTIPEGSNDGAFIAEILDLEYGETSKYRWFKDSLRKNLARFKIDYVDAQFIHINHGEERDYLNRAYFLSLLRPNLSEILHQDQLGLLNWTYRDPLINSLTTLDSIIRHTTIENMRKTFSELLNRKIFYHPKPELNNLSRYYSNSNNAWVETKNASLTFFSNLGFLYYRIWSFSQVELDSYFIFNAETFMLPAQTKVEFLLEIKGELEIEIIQNKTNKSDYEFVSYLPSKKEQNLIKFHFNNYADKPVEYFFRIIGKMPIHQITSIKTTFSFDKIVIPELRNSHRFNLFDKKKVGFSGEMDILHQEKIQVVKSKKSVSFYSNILSYYLNEDLPLKGAFKINLKCQNEFFVRVFLQAKDSNEPMLSSTQIFQLKEGENQIIHHYDVQKFPFPSFLFLQFGGEQSVRFELIDIAVH